jgi:hypothetical protein
MYGSFNDGLMALLSMEKAAYFSIMESVFAVDEHKCKVLMPWSTDFPSLLGMAVPKGSVYYELLRYQTLRQIEMGAWQVRKHCRVDFQIWVVNI